MHKPEPRLARVNFPSPYVELARGLCPIKARRQRAYQFQVFGPGKSRDNKTYTNQNCRNARYRYFPGTRTRNLARGRIFPRTCPAATKINTIQHTKQKEEKK